MKKLNYFIIILSLFSSNFLFGEELTPVQEQDFKVIALFRNVAMIKHEGTRKMLNAGEVYKGIKLISSNSHEAKFLVNGKELSLKLHQSKIGKVYSGGKKKTTRKKSVRILRDRTGMYRTVGFINGVKVNFLVDTGASQVAMNERVAKQVGLQYKLKGQKTSVSTAAGLSKAWFLPLKKVKVGSIELKQVEALVVKGAGPDEVLLGMSFLRQLKMQHDGDLLMLTRKF